MTSKPKSVGPSGSPIEAYHASVSQTTSAQSELPSQDGKCKCIYLCKHDMKIATANTKHSTT